MERDDMIHQGDCLDILKGMKSNSVDSLVTDPPAGISFMGKEWDEDKGGRKQWIAWMSEVMSECKRVLKPGAHALVWAIPRTSHWTATALEDAGFEIRDVVTHIFGSGFPKSLDISKAIDKAAGARREVVGKQNYTAPNIKGNNKYNDSNGEREGVSITAPATPEAKQWQGWGTALKPASEHWILCRKPLSEKTVAANVLLHGTGGINIDASRIGYDSDSFERNKKASEKPAKDHVSAVWKDSGHKQRVDVFNSQGRFPANLVLSHNEDCGDVCTPGCSVAELDSQAGPTRGLKDPSNKQSKLDQVIFSPGSDAAGQKYKNQAGLLSYGNVSRFFYCAKASKSDKNAGLEGMPKKQIDIGDERPSGTSWERRGRAPSPARENFHPTVKSTTLMSYLIRMITPSGGTVLDPFMGSGSTGVAAKREGFSFIGIEQDKDYIEIAKKRIYSKLPLFKKQYAK